MAWKYKRAVEHADPRSIHPPRPGNAGWWGAELPPALAVDPLLLAALIGVAGPEDVRVVGVGADSSDCATRRPFFSQDRPEDFVEHMRALVEEEASLMLQLVAEPLPAASQPVILCIEDRVDVRGVVVIVEPAIIDVEAVAFGEGGDKVTADCVGVSLENLSHDLAGVLAIWRPVGIAVAHHEPGLGFANDILEHRIDPAGEIGDTDRRPARSAIAAGATRLLGPNLGADDTRRYSFYETRKDLARPGDFPATRFQQGTFEQQVSSCLVDLLADEHALRRLSNISDAGPLRSMFAAAKNLAVRLSQQGEAKLALRSLVRSISIRNDHLEVIMDPAALGILDHSSWMIQIPRPTRRPFREARLRLDAGTPAPGADPKLVMLIADALEVQGLVLASPHLSLNQLAKQVGRCRKQMAKLLNLSWLSPRIVEAITDGSQPKSITRTRLLETELPLSWGAQEALLGFVA